MRNVLRSIWTATCLGLGAASAFAQGDSAPPTVEIVRWEVERGLITYLVYQESPPVGSRNDISAFLHQELDQVTITLAIADPDWPPPDPNNPDQQAEGEAVFLRFRAYPNILLEPPAAPPISAAFDGFVNSFTPGPGQTVIEYPLRMEVPEFNGRNQFRLRGLIAMDVQWLLEFAVSNTENPDPPECFNPLVNCDAQFLNAIENPELAEPNPPPDADAGPDQTVEAGAVVTLDGSRTLDLTNIGFDPSDPEIFADDTLTYTWEWISGPNGLRVDPVQTDATDPKATVTLTQLGVYVYRLLVDDNASDTLPTTDDVAITVVETLPENRAPRVVITGPANAVVEGTLIVLDASATSDPDNDPLTYNWQQTDELGGTLPADDFRSVFQPVGGRQSNKIAWQANQPGTFYFRLVVSDGEFISNARFSVQVIDRETAGYVVIRPRPADDAGDVTPPQNAADSVGPLLAPLCGAGLLPLTAVPVALLLLRRRF